MEFYAELKWRLTIGGYNIKKYVLAGGGGKYSSMEGITMIFQEYMFYMETNLTYFKTTTQVMALEKFVSIFL